MQKRKPAGPVRPHQVYTPPAPIPYPAPAPAPAPRPLHPAPKANHTAQEPGPSEGEWASFGRAIYAAKVRERKGYQQVQEARQKQIQLIAEMQGKAGASAAGGGANDEPVMVEPCSNCGYSVCVCRE